ncbi:MAG TPA: M20 family metallopeptidase [Spirochaetia bacterium]|nr:M20 family metallopeptidase [Spirochaetales bacterium]HRW24718.1 M20 family metallopeptidase [Spirochaetia bacterium]
MTDHRDTIFASVERNAGTLAALSDEVWGYAESGFEETRSSRALAARLEAEGFSIERGVAGMSTAFSASYGSGSPVVAILGEYDALPGLSQRAGLAEKRELEPGAWGHGCGHNLLGVGSLAAAVAVKDFIAASGTRGTVRFYGCPGEEFGCGKTFMTRAGAFSDVDLALCWHPMDINAVWQVRTLANLSVYFRFTGKASHAAAAPHLGRSALDAVELTNVGANYLREHVIPEARFHYAITNSGGRAPNVVQPFAEVFYYCRAPRLDQAREVYERVCDVARGAALMTGTSLEIAFSQGLSDYVPNQALGELLQRCMETAGPPRFDDRDRELAARFRSTLTAAELAGAKGQLKATQGDAVLAKIGDDPLDEVIGPLFRGDACLPGSTDVGDVSQVVPTGQLVYACAAIGTQSHSWQNTAQVGSPIGHKGMLAAGRALALAAAEAMLDPGVVEKAKAELAARGAPPYVCPIPDAIGPEDVLGSMRAGSVR